MNIYRSGDANHRKPALRPLTPSREKRSPDQPAITDSSQPTGSDAPDLRSGGIEPLRKRAAASASGQRDTTASTAPDITSSGDQPASKRLISRSVRVPIWAVIVATLLMLAVPSAVVITQVDPFGDGTSNSLPGPGLTTVEEPDAAGEPTARDLDALLNEDLFEGIEVDRSEPPARSSRQEYLAEQGVSPEDHSVRYRAEEIEQLQQELEAIQRNSAMLRSLAREQSGDLSSVYSSLEATQDDKNEELEDLQERVEELDARVETVDEIARELREMLDLPDPESGLGGPSAPPPDDSDPWLALRSEIVSIEHRAGALVLNLDEVNSEIEVRLAEMEEAEMEEAETASNQSAGSESAGSDVEYYSSMPSGWPVDGPLTSRFGLRDNPFGAGNDMHTGIDISAPMGTPLRATGGGTVRTTGQQGGYGLLVIIDHGGGVSTWYGHNSRILVSPGQSVNAGDVIAEVGSTGMSTGPHVHYEIRINGSPQDPMAVSNMN